MHDVIKTIEREHARLNEFLLELDELAHHFLRQHAVDNEGRSHNRGPENEPWQPCIRIELRLACDQINPNDREGIGDEVRDADRATLKVLLAQFVRDCIAQADGQRDSATHRPGEPSPRQRRQQHQYGQARKTKGVSGFVQLQNLPHGIVGPKGQFQFWPMCHDRE